jgi:streptogramin lyase
LRSSAPFREVSDVAVDADDIVYVLTRAPGLILVCDRSGTLGATWGEHVLSARPHGITIGLDGFIYCVDEVHHAVFRFDRTGAVSATIGTSGVPSDTGVDSTISDLHDRTATISRAAGPFNRPTALAVASNGDLYVADGYGNARIHRFTAAGDLVMSWGEPGAGRGQFHIPHGLCIDSEERILVADRENERIQVFNLHGDYVEEWHDVQRPAGLTTAPDGLTYVAELSCAPGYTSWTRPAVQERKPSRVSVLDRRGSVVARFGSGDDPCAPGTMAAAHGIAVDSHGAVYVAEITFTSLVSRGAATGLAPVPDDCHVLQKLVHVVPGP